MTERHRYIFDLIFNELLGLSWIEINDKRDAHINYSNKDGGLIHIFPHGLLSEEKLIMQDIIFEHVDGEAYFFQNKKNNGFPFDIFAASFYLVSRYEEYLPFKPDAHHRFPAHESILVKSNVLERPLVNEWANWLGKELVKLDAQILLNKPQYTFTSTIDIDQAWKYKYKGLMRNTIGFFTDILTFKKEKIKERIAVMFGTREDPFQNFDWQKKQHDQNGITPLYFFLLGKRGKFDKNIDAHHPKMIKLIQQVSKSSDIGIHPSYASNSDQLLVKSEIAILKDILNKEITCSRQHFLMHQFPTTYQTLIDEGIEHDYTMGYSTHLGFRAGIGRSFLFFDLTTNKKTNLRLHPFCYMDITPLHYLQWSPEKTIEYLETWMKSLENQGVHFQTLWHNESFSETERWKKWRVVYQRTLEIHHGICHNSHK